MNVVPAAAALAAGADGRSLQTLLLRLRRAGLHQAEEDAGEASRSLPPVTLNKIHRHVLSRIDQLVTGALNAACCHVTSMDSGLRVFNTLTDWASPTGRVRVVLVAAYPPGLFQSQAFFCFAPPTR